MEKNIKGWILEKPIGAGSTSIVYLAHKAEDPKLKAAVKVYKKEIEPKLEAVFTREISAIAKLDHPHIVRVLDWGTSPYFIAYELLEKTLEERVSEELLGFNEAMNIWVDVASAIAYAHSRGVIHRDLNPRNIMFDEENCVKVVDFGISAAVTEKIRTTLLRPVAEEVGLGTYYWSAPEQFKGYSDERSDIYSLGKLLHYLATSGGILPDKFTRAHLDSYNYPEELKDIVYESCRENPAERIQSVEEQIARVNSALSQAKEVELPEEEEDYLALGDMYYILMNYPLAEHYYKKALADNPEDTFILMKIGDCLLKEGKWSEAEKYLRKVLEKTPNNAYMWYLLGLSLYYQGKINEAVEAFRNSVTLNPYYYSSWLWLGLASAYLGLSAQAINAFNQAYWLNPQFSISISCPDCGGRLFWNPYKGTWYCPACKKYFTVEELIEKIYAGESFGFFIY
ncbi:MAG: hypothetical protein DRJ63_04795 [Thermoprotei archaeon]|nr:MAG: hypothetical protein DRJ63_04795 [Thermoprotei archaeon]